jgi:DNA-binding transcriptional LysR family regulator
MLFHRHAGGLDVGAFDLPMTLEQLRVFVAVAERQHMTRAAETLNLTQQAVSSAIVALENAYSTALFHRVGRHIELTEAGSLFLKEARSVLARVSVAELKLCEFSGLKRGTLRVAASQTIASYWLPHRLVSFHKAYPNIELRVGVGNTAQVSKAVIDGAAELGFIEGAIDEPTLACEKLCEDRLILVVAPDHPWASRDRIEARELTQSPWVLRERGSGTRSAFETSLQQLGIVPHLLNVALELPSNEAVREAVETGGGATVISELVVEAALRSGALRRISIDLPVRHFLVVRHRERYRSKVADTFLLIVRDDKSGSQRAGRRT